MSETSASARRIFAKVRRIEIQARRRVSDAFAGAWHSAYKGRGMEFDEVKEYTFGDDVRSIDWNVTARMDKPYIKKFREERELTVMLLVDASASLEFGSSQQMKGETAAEAAALLALSAVKNNDRIGLIAFTDRIEKHLPAAKGREHVLRMVREILFLNTQGRGTDIARALDFLGGTQRRRAVVFLITDGFSADFSKTLSLACARHDVTVIKVGDVRESQLPAVGLLELEDAESGESFIADSSSAAYARSWSDSAKKRDEAFEKMVRRSGAGFVQIATDGKALDRLCLHFMKHRKGGGGKP